MAFELYELKDAKIYRDKHDRLWMGPLMPPVGNGPEYFMEVSNRLKIHETPTIMNAVDDDEPEPVDTETAALCPVCDTPLTEAQIKKGGKYCSPTCRTKAANARAKSK